MEEGRVKQISILRVMAVLLVVIGHSGFVYGNSWPMVMREKSDLIWEIVQYIYSFHMPLFMAVSGYLFCYAGEHKPKKTAGSYIKARFFRLGLPCLLFTVFYLFPVRWWIGFYDLQERTRWQPWNEVFFTEIVKTGDIGHMWFVFSLFFIAVLFLFLEKYCNRFPIPAFALFFVLSLYHQEFPAVMLCYKLTYYLFYYYLGYLLCRHRKLFEKQVYTPVNGAAFFLLHLYAYYMSGKVMMAEEFSYRLGRHITEILGVLAFFTAAFWLRKAADGRFVRFIEKNSFGIYLFHDPVIYFILVKLMWKEVNPWLVVLLCFTLSIGLSILFTELLRRLGAGFLIGEPGKRKKEKNIQAV